MAEYAAKTKLVTQQYDRILTRFNYFLTIESGLIGVVGFMIQQKLYLVVYPLCVVGFSSALLWHLTSRADRKLVEAYRLDASVVYALLLRDLISVGTGSGHAKGASGESLDKALGFYEQKLCDPTQRLVLDAEKIARDRIPLAAGDVQGRAELMGGSFSVTRMPIWASLGTAIIWLGTFFVPSWVQ
jgi:hypothetical protein